MSSPETPLERHLREMKTLELQHMLQHMLQPRDPEKIAQLPRDPEPCPNCGVDRCGYCHECSLRDGEGVLHEDCTCNASDGDTEE